MIRGSKRDPYRDPRAILLLLVLQNTVRFAGINAVLMGIFPERREFKAKRPTAALFGWIGHILKCSGVGKVEFANP